HRADALRRPAERARGVEESVVVELVERLERDVEPPAIVEQRAVVIGNAPGAGIDVEPLGELAGLGGAAELGELVAAAQSPVAAAGTVVELQHLDPIARLAQLKRSRHAGQSRAKDKNGRALRIAFELDRSLVAR